MNLFPVENVSWDDAQVFIKRLNDRERARGYHYRLPTEAEWEYACRAGATTEEGCSYHFYFEKPTNELSPQQANFAGDKPFGDAPKGKWLKRPTRVGSYPPNQLGLCDMHGNVFQWCADLFQEGKSARLLRGCGWTFSGLLCTAGARVPEEPAIRRGFVGFRLVRVPFTSIPTAMILETAGAVRLHSPRNAKKQPSLQMLLYPDDRLSLAADSRMELVFLSDLHKERLKPGREVTIGRGGCEPADAVRERDDSILMTFVRLPKGTFYMGGGGGKAGKKTEIAEDFEIAVHSVTQGQWQALMGNNPCDFSRQGKLQNRVLHISDEELKLHPVENVSWFDAQDFIKKLNDKERSRGYLYRLPTEAEWEYACRAGAASEEDGSYHFYFARPTNDLFPDQANFKCDQPTGNAPKGTWLQRTMRVGAYPPNKLGLCDMHGNVLQWCADLRRAGGTERSGRGGSWASTAPGCLAAFLYQAEPTARYFTLGFRLVRVRS